MAFKQKFKNAWKRVSDLDDDTESAKKQSKEKERIPYKEISKRIKEVMKEHVDVVGRKILIPNYYALFFNEIDRNLRLEVEGVMCEELKEELFHEMRKINPEQNRRELSIEVKTDPNLAKGDFKIIHRMKKPADADAMPHSGTAPEAQPEVEEDYQQTLIETPALPDEQATIIQTPEQMAESTSAEPVEESVVFTIVVESGEKHDEIVLSKNVVSIGRSTQDDVLLESEDFSISRAHATVEVREGDYFLTPKGINGTLLNGDELELEKEVKITPFDEIKIMNYTLRIQG